MQMLAVHRMDGTSFVPPPWLHPEPVGCAADYCQGLYAICAFVVIHGGQVEGETGLIADIIRRMRSKRILQVRQWRGDITD